MRSVRLETRPAAAFEVGRFRDGVKPRKRLALRRAKRRPAANLFGGSRASLLGQEAVDRTAQVFHRFKRRQDFFTIGVQGRVVAHLHCIGSQSKKALAERVQVRVIRKDQIEQSFQVVSPRIFDSARGKQCLEQLLSRLLKMKSNSVKRS
jgi:hypothetical protein